MVKDDSYVDRPGALVWWREWRCEELVICAILFAGSVYAGKMQPFQQFITPGDPSYMYPFVPDTVSMDINYLIAGVVPAILIMIIGRLRRTPVLESWLGVVALAEAHSTIYFITNVLKNLIGRPRPDFFARGTIEGQRSFPSGHTSWAFAGLVYFTMWLLGQCRWTMQGTISNFSKCLLCFTPTFLALWISASRLTDYHHHYSDVAVGALLGVAGAVVCYRLNFSSVFNRSEAVDEAPVEQV